MKDEVRAFLCGGSTVCFAVRVRVLIRDYVCSPNESATCSSDRKWNAVTNFITVLTIEGGVRVGTSGDLIDLTR